MQAFITFFMVVAPLVMCYDEKFDLMDVDKILQNDDLFKAYINCILDKGECTVEHSTDIKGLMQEIVATSCEKCTSIQRTYIRKATNALQEKMPAEFEEFRKKYDPKGEYESNFALFLVGTN